MKAASFLLALLLSACVTSRLDVLTLDPSLRNQTEPKAVQLLTVEPTRPYDAIALVTIHSEYGEEVLKQGLIDATARVGGHAQFWTRIRFRAPVRP